MPDLTDLLDKNTDEIKVPVIPEGIWDGILVKGSVYDENNDGELPYSEKRQDNYIKVSLFFVAQSAVAPVSQQEADEFLSEGKNLSASAEWVAFIWGKSAESDLAKFKKRMEKLGAFTQGRSTRDIVEEIQHQEIPVRAVIEHSEYQGETQVRVRSLNSRD